MRAFALVLVFVGCVHKLNGPDSSPDAANLSDDGGHDASSGSADGGGSSSYTCTPIGGSSCCVFDTTLCTNGLVCQYDYVFDNSTFTTPSQSAGSCRAPGTLALGASCNVNTVPMGSALPTCGQGAWCAYDGNSGTTGLGVCRKLCDPLDQTVHGCQVGTTCIKMLYCADAAQWPNCPSAAKTHLGFCR